MRRRWLQSLVGLTSAAMVLLHSPAGMMALTRGLDASSKPIDCPCHCCSHCEEQDPADADDSPADHSRHESCPGCPGCWWCCIAKVPCCFSLQPAAVGLAPCLDCSQAEIALFFPAAPATELIRPPRG